MVAKKAAELNGIDLNSTWDYSRKNATIDLSEMIKFVSHKKITKTSWFQSLWGCKVECHIPTNPQTSYSLLARLEFKFTVYAKIDQILSIKIPSTYPKLECFCSHFRLFFFLCTFKINRIGGRWKFIKKMKNISRKKKSKCYQIFWSKKH